MKLGSTLVKEESSGKSLASSKSKLGWLYLEWWGSRKEKLGCIWKKMESSLDWCCLESTKGLMGSRIDWRGNTCGCRKKNLENRDFSWENIRVTGK